MEFKVDAFMELLYKQNFSGQNELDSCSAEEFEQVKAKKREELKKLLGIDKLEAFHFQPVTQFLRTETHEGIEVDCLAIEVLPGLVVPFYKLKPGENRKVAPDGREKALLYCHGHGDGGVRDCFVVKDPVEYHKNAPLQMAKYGYTVYMHEPVGFGDFNMKNFKEDEYRGCYAITTQLLLYGITTVGLRVFVTMKMLDYILDECGAYDVAVFGISGGGTVTTFTAALCDRMKAAVISCYANMFKDCILRMQHCIDNFIPNISQIGELPYVVALAAPKPLFVTNGISDPIFPLAGAKEDEQIVRRIYQKLGIEDRIGSEYFEGEHEFSFAFAKWLDDIL